MDTWLCTESVLLRGMQRGGEGTWHAKHVWGATDSDTDVLGGVLLAVDNYSVLVLEHCSALNDLDACTAHDVAINTVQALQLLALLLHELIPVQLALADLPPARLLSLWLGHTPEPRMLDRSPLTTTHNRARMR